MNEYYTTDKVENNPATVTVAEISKIHFDGNVIPHQWFEAIKMPNGKTDSIGVNWRNFTIRNRLLVSLESSNRRKHR